MGCSQTDNQLQKYIDGELSPESRKKIQQHIEDCSECQAELATIKQLNNLLNEVPPVPSIPTDFASKTISKVNQVKLVDRFTERFPLAAAASLLIGLLVGISVSNQFVGIFQEEIFYSAANAQESYVTELMADADPLLEGVYGELFDYYQEGNE